jgi:hypothetical protein
MPSYYCFNSLKDISFNEKCFTLIYAISRIRLQKLWKFLKRNLFLSTVSQISYYQIPQPLSVTTTNMRHYNQHHSVVCLKTGPQHLPTRVLYRLRYSASSLNLQHPPFSSRSFSSCLRLLIRLPVTSMLPSISASMTCFRRQFLHYNIQLHNFWETYVWLFCAM